MSEVNVKKGLEGVVVDTTAVSKVMPEINSLVYKGYPVQDLADKKSFEEVAYLLLNGELPTESQNNEFTSKEKKYRKIPDELINTIKSFPKDAHAMDAIRTCVSYLGLNQNTYDLNNTQENHNTAIDLLAKIPTCVAAFFRHRKGLEIIPPKNELTLSENFFHMCFGETPDPIVTKAFDASLVLYAEHGFNASTFTSRVIASTTSDMYSSITGAIGALKGPLHGGANEAVMHMLIEVEDPSKAKEWMLDALKNKKKVMGFGHRVYKKGDSRAPTMNKYGLQLAKLHNNNKWHEISKILEETMIAEKNIYPNLDFPAAPAYYLMGFDIDMFTPIFVMSRVSGWCAHIMEQWQNNRIIRPLCQYIGPNERPV